MTKIRPIVKAAFRCDALAYQFCTIDVEDGLLTGGTAAEIVAEVNAKYDDRHILSDALNRQAIALDNVQYLDTDDLDWPTYNRELGQLNRFISKWGA